MTTRRPAAFPAAVTGFRVTVGPQLSAALGVASLGTVLLAAAPAFTVAIAEDGASTDPAFTSGPLLAVLAVAPAALAWLFAVTGRIGTAAGLLAGLAALAPGRAVLDLQLLAAPWRAVRPELLVSTSLAPLRAGAGVWLLLAGHVLTAAAGVFALLAVRRTGSGGGAGAVPIAVTTALCAGAATAVGLALAPFRTSDPYLVPRAALDAPLITLAGLLLVGAGLVLAACLAAGAADADAGRGGLMGVQLGAAALILPPLAAAVFSPSISTAWGPRVALIGFAGLGVALRLIGHEAGADGAAEQGPPALSPPALSPPALSPPALGRLHVVAGAVAVFAGAAALVGAVARQVLVPAGLDEPVLHATRVLVPAGLLLAGLGAALLVPARAALASSVRPVLAVAWAGMVLACAAVLDAALTATQIVGVRAGAGLWAVTVALLAACAVGVLTLLAGLAERDEADLSELNPGRVPLAVGTTTVVLAVAAFGLPLQTAPDYVPAGLWFHFGAASWGLLAAAAVVCAAALLAPRSRPERAVGSLLGAAAVMVLHLAQVPLAGGRAGAGADVGPGVWFGLACLATLLAGAGLAWHARVRAPRGAPARGPGGVARTA